jgi:hypothetical protein
MLDIIDLGLHNNLDYKIKPTWLPGVGPERYPYSKWSLRSDFFAMAFTPLFTSNC